MLELYYEIFEQFINSDLSLCSREILVGVSVAFAIIVCFLIMFCLFLLIDRVVSYFVYHKRLVKLDEKYTYINEIFKQYFDTNSIDNEKSI